VPPLVDQYVSSWPTEKKPDYEQFISFVLKNESVWKDDAATVTPSEAIVLNALFPEKVIELQKKKWLGMDMIHTFMSTLCKDQSTVYFDWEMLSLHGCLPAWYVAQACYLCCKEVHLAPLHSC
jgi:hypothetical protein